jgi:hypothetical protein
MKKVVKTSEILNLYTIINSSKYSGLDSSDAIKIWKITRIMKPIATKFEEDSKDAQEKMKPSGDFDERLQKAQEYERNKTSISKEEYDEFLREFREYQNTVSKAIQEFANVEVELEFDPISEDVFGKYMSINDWTLE